MNDEQMITALRRISDPDDGVRMNLPVEQITRRARSRRLRRGLSASAVGCVTIGTALGLGVGLSPAGPQSQPVHISTAGFTVNTTADGLVDVTVSELRNPALMRQALARAGVPALVWVGTEPCTGGPVTGTRIQQVIKYERQTGDDVAFSVDPAAIPPGSELNVGFASPGHPLAEGIPVTNVISLTKDGC
jgi:hypothetical protein